MSTPSVTQEQLNSKAIKIIRDTGRAYPQLNGRTAAAVQLIESHRVLRQGLLGQETVYWVASSADYTTSLLATKHIASPPYYRVVIAPEGVRCTCDDFAWGGKSNGHTGAPIINGQPICKHILAARAIELARERLGLDLATEQFEAEIQREEQAENDKRRAWFAQFPPQTLDADGLPDIEKVAYYCGRKGKLVQTLTEAMHNPDSFYHQARIERRSKIEVKEKSPQLQQLIAELYG